MVLTLGNGQIWLGTSPSYNIYIFWNFSVLQYIYTIYIYIYIYPSYNIYILVLQYISIFFHFVVCNCLFTKNIRSFSDIGKMKECFRRYVFLKNFNFLMELM